MEEKIRASIEAAFAADALALGVHWVYDTQAIKKRYGRLTEITAPELAEYHQGKDKGAFTHYGDQAMVLLNHIACHNGFEAAAFAQEWEFFFTAYKGYVDHASQEALKNLRAGADPSVSGALSMELGGASRIFPLALLLAQGGSGSDFVQACAGQTRLTHNTPHVVGSAKFLAETYLGVLAGESPVAAMEGALSRILELPFDLSARVKMALASWEEESREVMENLGTACAWEGALPGAVHLMAKYEDDLETALVENIMAGGDSAARGMVVGWILGAWKPEGLPERWVGEVSELSKIRSLMAV